jgi:hypothetical protein
MKTFDDLEVTKHRLYTQRAAYIRQKKNAPTKVKILVARAYPLWMQETLDIVSNLVVGEWPLDSQIVPLLMKNELCKKHRKNLMGFVAEVKKNYLSKGSVALSKEWQSNDKQLFEDNLPMLKKFLSVEEIEVLYNDSEDAWLPVAKYS